MRKYGFLVGARPWSTNFRYVFRKTWKRVSENYKGQLPSERNTIYKNNEGQERQKPSFPKPRIYNSKSWGYCFLRLHGCDDWAYVSGKITHWFVFGSFLFSYLRHAGNLVVVIDLATKST